MILTAAIAASYFGAEVICAPYGGQPERKITGTMIGLNNHGIDIKFPEWQSPHQIAIDKCQLLLTPLSKISDEDAVEVAKILDLNYSDTDENYYLDLVGMREYLSELFDGVNRFQDSYTFDKISKLIHYCQSHTIDIGHGYGDNHIPSLIAAGVAVEKTNL